MNKLVLIEQMERQIFTAQDLAVLWGYDDEQKLYELIKYYVRKKQIFAIARGLYATKPYSQQDLRDDPKLLFAIANKLVPNSYISLFTVLKKCGVIFQYYDEIFSVAKRSATRRVRGLNFVYKQIKSKILLSELGVEQENGVRIASLERAIADIWYLYPRLNVDGLERVNMKKLRKIARLYEKKSMLKKIQELELELASRA
ncbi:hypothetical protein KJ707_03885 [Patescibacteria group bacterium]|nr:hypothetical protein [Patescibacteria group bacterium]MBU1966766.1 hypothetical protein [Patescibacteria group bacterium]MBU2543671.1 hypothetical protein [Patescibacteria group bacterium]